MNQTHVPVPGSAQPPGDRTRGMNRWMTLLVVSIGAFMGNLDVSIVNISLPAIAHTFGTSISGSLEWVVIGYLIVIASVLLTIGRLADTLGRKPIWVTGLVVFTAGSALCGAAPTLPLLIGARGLQGLGAACLMAVGPAILTGGFPPQERGRALGLITVTIALSIGLGPTLGGLITQHFTWRGIFYVNVPLGLAGIWLALRLLRERQMPQRQRRFDVPGALCLAVGLGALLTGLSFGQQWGWTSPPVIALVILSVFALGSLLLVERFAEYPLFARSFLTNRVFLSANVSLALGMLALFAINVLVPFYLVEVRAFSPAQAGLLLTPLPLTFALVSPFSGSLADRIGTRWLAAGGLSGAGARQPIERHEFPVGYALAPGVRGSGASPVPRAKRQRLDGVHVTRRTGNRLWFYANQPDSGTEPERGTGWGDLRARRWGVGWPYTGRRSWDDTDARTRASPLLPRLPGSFARLCCSCGSGYPHVPRPWKRTSCECAWAKQCREQGTSISGRSQNEPSACRYGGNMAHRRRNQCHLTHKLRQ